MPIRYRGRLANDAGVQAGGRVGVRMVVHVENPDVLTDQLLAWCAQDDRVSAVILTGSRARHERVDRFSDLDVELISPCPERLADDESWIAGVGDPMVVLPFDLDHLTTRLVVYAGGRKIDFGIWPEDRIQQMIDGGLDELYDRGYRVLLDKGSLTTDLPAPKLAAPVPPLPDQAEFARLESEFWFEATQVAVYLVRQDLWVVKFRENTMHQCLLTMLEWQAQSDPSGPRFTWHLGHHIDEWLSKEDYEAAGAVFTHFDGADTIRGIQAAMDLFEQATTAAAGNMALRHRPELARGARRHALSILEGQLT